MDQIMFLKLKGDICHKSVGVFLLLFVCFVFECLFILYEEDSFSLPSKPAKQTVNVGEIFYLSYYI